MKSRSSIWDGGSSFSPAANVLFRRLRIFSRKQLEELVRTRQLTHHVHEFASVRVVREIYAYFNEQYSSTPKVPQWYDVFKRNTARGLLRAGVTSMSMLEEMLKTQAGIDKLLNTRSFGESHLKEIVNHFKNETPVHLTTHPDSRAKKVD